MNGILSKANITTQGENRQKTIIIKSVLIIILLIPIPIYFLVVNLIYLQAPVENQPWVSWFDDPHQRVYVSWETEEDTIGVIYYGTDYNNLSLEITEVSAKRIHHVILEKLTANTKYYYEINIGGEIFGEGEFKTAPLSIVPFKWVMISDTQRMLGSGHHWRTAKALKGKNYSFIANIGDLVESGNWKEEFHSFFHIASSYLKKIPIVPVIGNHDSYGTSLFQDYFINGMNNPHDLFYYSFNWSSVHFQICHFPYGTESEIELQVDWIRNDLENSLILPFRIVMFHVPIIGGGFYGYNENLDTHILPILKEYNVTAVIHGHEHHYERGLMGDTMYMILGGGGGTLDPGLRPGENTECFAVTPSYTEVYADSSTLNLKTFTLTGELIDDYTLYI